MTIALAEAGETFCSRASAVTETRPLAGLEVVERLQVVLDRVAERGFGTRPVYGGIAVASRASMLIRLGHSPDPDDAFMFWGLASGEVDPRRFEFEHVLKDIQTLNTWALDGKLEVSAISLAAYPLVQDDYVLLPHGASMGSGYGPIVVAREEMSAADARDVEIAVPGELTTAFLVLRMCLGPFRYRAVPFDADHRRGQVGPRRRRAADPRGPAHLRGRRA